MIYTLYIYIYILKRLKLKYLYIFLIDPKMLFTVILSERQPFAYPENQQAAEKDDGCGDDKIEMEIKMKVKMMMEISQYFLKVKPTINVG